MLTKPADEDSDDDVPMQQATQAAQNPAAAQAAAAHGATVSPPAAAAPERSISPTDSLSSNFSSMRMNNASMQSFGELDKLRDRQRTEIVRNNQSRLAQGLPTPGIYSDLAGLDWTKTSLPAPMDPRHASETRDGYGQGSLSDYSDYS